MSNFVALIVVYDRALAELFQQLLLSYGIRTVLSASDQGGARPHLASSLGISVMVPDDQKEEAIDLIRDFQRVNSVTGIESNENSEE